MARDNLRSSACTDTCRAALRQITTRIDDEPALGPTGPGLLPGEQPCSASARYRPVSAGRAGRAAGGGGVQGVVPPGYTAAGSSSSMKPRVLLGSTGMPGPMVVVIVAFLT